MPDSSAPTTLQVQVDDPKNLFQKTFRGAKTKLEKMFHGEQTQSEKMSREDKTQSIDRELRQLQAKCIKSGYTAAQVEKFARSFFQASRKAKRDNWMKRMIGVGVVVLLCCGLLQFQSPCRLLACLARAAQIKTLSVWDWTEVYHSNCLLSNPLYAPPDTLTLQHCQICEGIQSIENVQNMSGSELMEKFFKRDVPVIVDNGLKDWHDVTIRTPRDVAELFENNEVLRSSGGCGFSSNLGSQGGGHRAFLNTLLTENISHYFAHWENCEGRAAKTLRSVFKRPEFLPPAVELSATSWLFLSDDYTASIFKQVDIGHSLVLLLQVSGEVEVQVQAWRPCDDLCPVLHHTLQAGQVLVVTEFLWKVKYLPTSDRENLGIGLGGSF